MLSNLEIEPRDGYLYVRYRGDVTREIAEALIRETAAHGEELGLRNYLVDLRDARHLVRTGEDYTIAYERAAKLGLQAGSRTILLVDPAAVREWEFVGTVFRNAGFTLDIGTDEAAAMAALLR